MNDFADVRESFIQCYGIQHVGIDPFYFRVKIIQQRDVARAMDVLRLLVPGFRPDGGWGNDQASPQADARNIAVN